MEFEYFDWVLRIQHILLMIRGHTSLERHQIARFVFLALVAQPTWRMFESIAGAVDDWKQQELNKWIPMLSSNLR